MSDDDETIRQRFEDGHQRKDCFLCCAAMATGHTYEQAWTKLGDELRAVFGPNGRGPVGDQCDRVLKALGLDRAKVSGRGAHPTEPGDYWVLFILPEYATQGFLRNILWGRRALLQVRSKNYADEHHIIYWDGGDLRDPSNKRRYAWPETEPVYIWLFNERTGK